MSWKREPRLAVEIRSFIAFITTPQSFKARWVPIHLRLSSKQQTLLWITKPPSWGWNSTTPMSMGVGISVQMVGRFAAVWLPKSADPKKDAVMAMSRWDTELGGLGLGGHITGDPAIRVCTQWGPSDPDPEKIETCCNSASINTVVSMLVTASVRVTTGTKDFSGSWTDGAITKWLKQLVWHVEPSAPNAANASIKSEAKYICSCRKRLQAREIWPWGKGVFAGALGRYRIVWPSFFFWGCGMELW